MWWYSRTVKRDGDGGLKREKLISSCVTEKKSSKEMAQTAEIRLPTMLSSGVYVISPFFSLTSCIIV